MSTSEIPFIRPMSESDLDSVLVMERASFPRPWIREHFMAEILSPHGFPVVAEFVDCLAGFLCLSVLLDEAEILDVAVDPDLRRSGVGRALLTWACSKAGSCGAKLIRLEVRESATPAIKLYENFGFALSGRRKAYYEGREDALLMEKQLA